MTNTPKRKPRRLKKQICRTLGTMLLISALIVAAIPVENLRAGIGDIEVGVDINNCRIPLVDASEQIYTTGDGMFQFAYVTTNDTSAGNKVAVILGYDGGRREGGVLTIPNSVDAYMKYTESLGSSYGYCAVGKNRDPLFYMIWENVYDDNGNQVFQDDLSQPILDDEGNPTGAYEQIPVTQKVYKPCFYEDYDEWSQLQVDEFYYISGYTTENGVSVPVYALTTDSSKQRIQGATVRYIGNQYLQAGEGDESGTWTVAGVVDSPEKGIFRGEKSGNIVTLNVGSEMSGIGDYAFYGCTNLSSITLENGLDTIGNYAFANCVNLEQVNLDILAMLSTIGHHAFANCRGLQSFVMPRQVNAIGDSAFEGCNRMENIELCGNGKNVQLNRIGKNAFRNCAALTSLTLPESFEENDVDISMFEGCNALQFIKVNNRSVNFAEGENPSFGFSEFKETIPDTFYFEGMQNSSLHHTATANSIAFKYLDNDVYEITITQNGQNAVYQVNSMNQLIRCDIPMGMTEIDIPEKIGPYNIISIDSSSFQGSCSIKKIKIPSSITRIEANAFKGCHNLKAVIFSEPVNIEYIGENAFQTQMVELHKTGCNGNMDTSPVLQFVGPVDKNCLPFNYAMNENNFINVGSQYRSYITYYSSWPQNLQIRYNYETGKSELVNYPTFTELREISSMTRTEALEKYPCMTEKTVDDYLEAVQSALSKTGSSATNNEELTDYEREILEATNDIVLPEGIDSVRPNLFTDKETADIGYGLEKNLTAYDLDKIEAQTFEGCENFKEIRIYGDCTEIGDYAFRDCIRLDTVVLPYSLSEMGKVPFIDCGALSYVDFSGNSKYCCENSIIYEKDAAGNKVKILEYLKGRLSGVVNADELSGISEIAEEAFRDTNVSYVDLSATTVKTIPEYAFADTPVLSFVYLPRSWECIEANAFSNSALQYLDIPGSQGIIDNSAFENHVPSLTFHCEEGSSARRYAMQHNILYTDREVEHYWTVRFWDPDNNLLDTQVVKGGEDAVPPVAPERPGFVHTGWIPDYHGVNRDMDITAQYTPEDPDIHKVTVNFVDYDGTLLDTQRVTIGTDAVPPADPQRDGYVFTGWVPGFTDIQADTTCVAQYDTKDNRFLVRFIDYDGKTVINSQLVEPNGNPILPKDPKRKGYIFKGWLPEPKNITSDLDTYAQYERDPEDIIGTWYRVRFYEDDGKTLISEQEVKKGEDAVAPAPPKKNGYKFVKWMPSYKNIKKDTDIFAKYERVGGSSDDPSDPSDPSSPSDPSDPNQPISKFYTLTVKNGSGSGSYAVGSQPIIVANDPPAGKVFSDWTIEPSDTKIASKVMSATVLTMPAKNVTVTANYKKGTSGSTGTTTTGSSNSSVTYPGHADSTEYHYGGGKITIIIDKTGMSNTGVVSATISGSSEDYVIKITESASAAENAVKALMSEYNDISSINYFPMDISLYDAKGEKKITDTEGLTVSLTLPLPDDFREYGGNNKVASVTDGKLEKLQTKFTTISGVPCVTFTAKHFSPYTIYVDTNRLASGSIVDSTPKTGDGIHPKWFLAMGLLLASIVVFMKKDNKTPKRIAVSQVQK